MRNASMSWRILWSNWQHCYDNPWQRRRELPCDRCRLFPRNRWWLRKLNQKRKLVPIATTSMKMNHSSSIVHYVISNYTPLLDGLSPYWVYREAKALSKFPLSASIQVKNASISVGIAPSSALGAWEVVAWFVICFGFGLEVKARTPFINMATAVHDPTMNITT